MNQELTKQKVCTTVKSNYVYHFFKRLLDIVVGAIGSVFLLPIAVIIKLAFVFTKDNGPLFFVQKRVGKNGKTIHMYKFRSMIIDAEDILKELMEQDEQIREEYTKNKKLENDPRITKVGKFIRNTCIDEMPQFLNLLKGDMTLIGPRPYLLAEVPDMGDAYDDIVSVKPGITGFWQVSEKKDKSFNRRCVLERYYANNYNWLLDMKIFVKTFAVVLFNKGTK